MNRRSFIETIVKGSAAFGILPSALTYKRTWRPSWKMERGLWSIDWGDARESQSISTVWVNSLYASIKGCGTFESYRLDIDLSGAVLVGIGNHKTGFKPINLNAP